MHQRDVVIRGDAVAERAEPLLAPLHLDAVGQRVLDVLQLLVGGRVRQEEAVLVADGHAPDDARAGDARVDHWDVRRELSLEHAVEVLGAADGHEAVGVRQRGEDADVVRVFELAADGHGGGG